MSKECLTHEEMLEHWPELADDGTQFQFEVSSLVPIMNTNKEEVSTAPILPPLCINCHWVSIPYARDLEGIRCFAKENCAGTNLVNGENVYYFPLCIQQRDFNNRNSVACGIAGKWFKKKELPPIQSVTIGGLTPRPLELVPTKPKPGSIKRLTKEDLENI